MSTIFIPGYFLRSELSKTILWPHYAQVEELLGVGFYFLSILTIP